MEVEVVRSSRRRRTVSAREVDGILRVAIPASMSATDEARWVDELRRRHERRTTSAAVDLPVRARALARRFGLPRPAEVRWVSNQSTRWGSCTPSQAAVRVSDRVAAYPDWVLDYVLVHELAHLVHADHSAAFWDVVARYPLAERARGYLLAKGGDADG